MKLLNKILQNLFPCNIITMTLLSCIYIVIGASLSLLLKEQKPGVAFSQPRKINVEYLVSSFGKWEKSTLSTL
jgi:hypothetical protein